ncbi:MAG: hypothetical protein IKC35_02435 [Clostridia bacterium]|nr:hypothetical protein [Clostridia bacterium]
MQYIKAYVAVTVFVDEQGQTTPLSVFYDGRQYVIDKIKAKRKAPPLHVGGLITTRYDCLIRGKERALYQEITGRWFVEIMQIQND